VKGIAGLGEAREVERRAEDILQAAEIKGGTGG